jgi:hypothetical protein
MPAGPISVNQGKESGTRKRGGKLSGNRSHQLSAAHIGVRPTHLNLAMTDLAEEMALDEG